MTAFDRKRSFTLDGRRGAYPVHRRPPDPQLPGDSAWSMPLRLERGDLCRIDARLATSVLASRLSFRDAVSLPFGPDVELELGKACQHIEQETAIAPRGVDTAL